MKRVYFNDSAAILLVYLKIKIENYIFSFP